MDVTSAFYAVVRELALETPMGQRERAAIADSTQVPPSAMESLKKKLNGDAPILRRAGASAHLCALREELSRASWFVCEGSDHVSPGINANTSVG